MILIICEKFYIIKIESICVTTVEAFRTFLFDNILTGFVISLSTSKSSAAESHEISNSFLTGEYFVPFQPVAN